MIFDIGNTLWKSKIGTFWWTFPRWSHKMIISFDYSWFLAKNLAFLDNGAHPMFLEHWNRQKSLSNIWQHFSCLLDEWIAKLCKKKITMFFLKFTLSVLRCTWTGQINLKILLGYNIYYLSIWPFMHHPWFPTRKASP
jgi:hypothetical protein